MHLNNAILASLLPAFSMATSFRQGGGGGGSSDLTDGNAGIAPGKNTCGLSGFQTTTASEYPTIADCKALIVEVAADEVWDVTNVPTFVVSNHTCGFGVVTGSGADPALKPQIGNADIIDLTNDSIKNHAIDGRIGVKGSYKIYVGASGTMKCDDPALATGQQTQVDWTIAVPPKGSN